MFSCTGGSGEWRTSRTFKTGKVSFHVGKERVWSLGRKSFRDPRRCSLGIKTYMEEKIKRLVLKQSILDLPWATNSEVINLALNSIRWILIDQTWIRKMFRTIWEIFQHPTVTVVHRELAGMGNYYVITNQQRPMHCLLTFIWGYLWQRGANNNYSRITQPIRDFQTLFSRYCPTSMKKHFTKWTNITINLAVRRQVLFFFF